MAPVGQPQADVADARSYVPRPASDEVLAALAAWLEGEVDTAVVAGAPGVGTTLLLRVLEQRERGRRRVLFSPFLHIEPELLERWLASLALGSTSSAAEDWLTAFACEVGARPLLLVDDAHAATPATLAALGRLRRTRAPGLAICLGGCAGSALTSAARALGDAGVLTLALPPWSAEDLRGLAEGLCALPGLDAAARERLAREDLAALAAAAEGSPRLLRHTLLEGDAVPADAPVLAPLAPSTAPAERPSPRGRPSWLYPAALAAGFSMGLFGGSQVWDTERAPSSVSTVPAAVSAAPPAVATSTLLDVQVNAQPWAWIRIDGQSVGVTPLIHRDVPSGEHEFEATFPDGRQERRTVEIGPDSHFVSFP
jgi:hypothetical protein